MSSKPAAAPKHRTSKPGPPQQPARNSARRGEPAPPTRLTHPDKVLFPKIGLNKQDLADYFADVADVMLTHVAGHPLSLVRCPQGRARTCFFQKHHTGGLPAALMPLPIPETDGEAEPYIVLHDAEGLRACAQIGALELHVWGAPADRLEQPDRLVLDLDPGEDVSFTTVRKAAREVRDLLASLALPSFPLLTGGKGIHVVVPLDGSASWDGVKAFAAAVARALATEAPERYVAKAAKADRHGRIFVDYLRNTRGATAVAPYSPRAREGAPVATPVRWEELSRISSAAAFTTGSLPRRLGRLAGDPWDGYGTARAAITPEMTKRLQENTGGTRRPVARG